MKKRTTLTHSVRAVGLCVAGSLALALTASAAAANRYRVTGLGTLPNWAYSYVNAWGGGPVINNRGHIAAFSTAFDTPYAWTDSQPFLWLGPGQIETLPGLPGRPSNTPMGMNDHDQIVGWSGFDYSSTHPVLWDHGVAYALEIPGGDYMMAAPVGINNNGTIVGVGSTPGFALVSAFVWIEGHIHTLPQLVSGGIFTQANAINDRGQIAGASGQDWWADFHAVLWDHGQIIDLGTLGGVASMANAINDGGQIAGQSQVANGDWHMTLWQKGGAKDLGNFGTDPLGAANDINNRGQVVGVSSQSDGSAPHALLWERGSLLDLQTLIPPNSGWSLQSVQAINDRGQIAGWGLHNGQARALLLTPNDQE